MLDRRSLIAVVVAIAIQPFGCGDDAGESSAASSSSDASVPASGGAAAGRGAVSGGSGGSAGAAAVAGSAGASTAPVGGDGATPVDAGAGDPQDGGANAPTKPFPDGAVSKPGEYSGFGDKLYAGFELSSEYVAVRDGTKLAVDLYRPKDASGKVTEERLPVLWMHTPYNRRYFSSGGTMGLAGETYPGAAARLVDYGYVVAVVDFRGLYASFGENAAYNRGEWLDAARFDAYDITEWLAAQPWSSGNVGMWGCSATGGSQMQATTTAPPSLKAVFPMSCEFDAYPFGVPGGMAPAQGATRAPPTTPPPSLRNTTAEPVDGADGRSQLQEAIASHGPDRDNPGYVPFRDSTAENIPEQWWVKSSPHTYLADINKSGIAFYLAANWDEAATKYGAFFTLNNLTTPAKLIVGPAGHCAWFTVENQTGFDITIEERRFFDRWLKGIENGVMDEPKVYYYTYGATAGREWASAPAWPLPHERRVAYYLGDKSLGITAPSETSVSDEVTVDYDVTAATAADSGLVFETPALEAPVQVTGHSVVDLWLSSTATDSDVVAYVQNVAPDGSFTSYQMHGRLRASQRREAKAPYENLGLPWHPFGEADAQPLVAGEPVQLRFDILPFSMVFEAGHKIRLVLTFADTTTPRVSPAPSVRIYRDAEHPSSITFPIIDG
ncbi:MAG: CocE/NonD family hydrolase [Polyangiales bacterium]